MRDLEHFFGRGYLVAIVYSPSERYVLVHGHCSDPKSLCVTQGIARVPPVTGVTIFAFGNSATVFRFVVAMF